LVKYNFANPIIIGDTPVNFHPEIITEEVKTLSLKGKKKFQKVAKTFLMTTLTFLMSSSKSMAETLNKTETLPTSSVGMPPELMEFMMTTLVIIIGVGIILAAILFASAGIMRMLGKKRRKEAEEWSVDIIKGLFQILVSVPIVFIIYYIVSMALKGSGMFVSPF
jgi:hypothetical protein